MWAAFDKETGKMICKADLKKDVRDWCKSIGKARSSYTLRRLQKIGG